MAKNYSESIDWNKDETFGFEEIDTGTQKKGKGGITNGTPYGKCSDTHKPLKLGKYSIAGGACSYPVGGPYDIEIALDNFGATGVYPWNNQTYVFFPIQDMGLPKDVPQFRKLIEWSAEQIKAGKKVHVGCIGGHGRTGMFLVALYAYMFPDKAKDAIKYVREHYCKRAVETDSQCEFLTQQYKVGPEKGYKSGLPPINKGSSVQTYSTKGGVQYLNTSEEDTEDWWLRKQKDLFNKEKRGKESGGSHSPRKDYSGYGAYYNRSVGVPQELRCVEPIRETGRLFLKQYELDEILLAYEADL